MVKDAEENKEADRKFHELVNARNQADNMIHSVTKAMKDLGEEVAADEKTKIEAAIESLKEVLKSEDKEAIEKKTQELTDISAKLAERVYAKKGGGAAGTGEGGGSSSSGGEHGGSGTTQGGEGGAQEGKKENVVDAEYEEVKDK